MTTYELAGFGDPAAELARLREQTDAMWELERHAYGHIPPGTLLEVGMGSGAFLQRWQAAGHNVFGVDVDVELLAAVDGIRRVRADGRALPFADGTFDAVVSRLMLQHVVHPESVVCEMLRVTRPAGRVVVADADLQTLIVHPDPPIVCAARQQWISSAKAMQRDPYVGRRLREFFVEAGVRDICVEVVTVSTDVVGRETFARMLMAPYLNSGLTATVPEHAEDVLAAWIDDERSFGMANLVVARGTA